MGTTTKTMAGALASVAIAAGLATPALAQATTHPAAASSPAAAKGHTCSVKGLHPKVEVLAESGASCREARSLPGKLFRLDSRKGFGARKVRTINGWHCSAKDHNGGACLKSKKSVFFAWA